MISHHFYRLLRSHNLIGEGVYGVWCMVYGILVGFINGGEGAISHHFNRLLRSHNLIGEGVYGVWCISRVC